MPFRGFVLQIGTSSPLSTTSWLHIIPAVQAAAENGRNSIIAELMELNMLVLFIQKATCVSGETGKVPKENADSNEPSEP